MRNPPRTIRQPILSPTRRRAASLAGAHEFERSRAPLGKNDHRASGRLPCLAAAGVKVGDEEMAALDIRRNEFHGEWNRGIKPHDPNRSDDS